MKKGSKKETKAEAIGTGSGEAKKQGSIQSVGGMFFWSRSFSEETIY